MQSATSSQQTNWRQASIGQNSANASRLPSHVGFSIDLFIWAASTLCFANNGELIITYTNTNKRKCVRLFFVWRFAQRELYVKCWSLIYSHTFREIMNSILTLFAVYIHTLNSSIAIIIKYAIGKVCELCVAATAIVTSWLWRRGIVPLSFATRSLYDQVHCSNYEQHDAIKPLSRDSRYLDKSSR